MSRPQVGLILGDAAESVAAQFRQVNPVSFLFEAVDHSPKQPKENRSFPTHSLNSEKGHAEMPQRQE